MIKINLLPKEIEKKAAKREVGFLVILGVGLVLAILALLYAYTFTRYVGLNNKLSEVNRELAELKKITDQVDRLQAAKNKLSQKLNVIKDIIKGRLNYPKLMDDLVQLVSSNMWLRSVRAKDGANMVQLDIKAVAFDNFIIADFMTALENSTKFTGVELTSLSSMKSGENNYRQFGITCTYLLKY